MTTTASRLEAGAIVDERVYPIGTALRAAGHVREGYTMQEVIDKLANEPAAMRCAREALKGRSSESLTSVKLLAPIENPPSIWAAAANYKAHQEEMTAASGGQAVFGIGAVGVGERLRDHGL